VKKYLLLFLIISSQALAFSFSIDQPSVHLQSSPGQTSYFEITVTNKNDFPVTVSVYANDWVYRKDQFGKLFYAAGSSKYSLANDLELPAEKVSLLSAQSKVLKFSLKTPAKAQGGRVGVLFFQTEMPGGNQGLNYAGRIGSIIYQEIIGTLKKEMLINSARIYQQGNHTLVEIAFENKGNCYNYFHGAVSLLDTQDNVLQTIPVRLEALPGDELTRKLSFPLELKARKALLGLENSTQRYSKVILADNYKETISQQLTATIQELPGTTSNTITIEKLNILLSDSLLKLYLKAATSQNSNLTAQVIINNKTGQTVKTIALGQKFFQANKADMLAANWDCQALGFGEYTLYLQLTGQKPLPRQLVGKLRYNRQGLFSDFNSLENISFQE